MSIPAAEQLSMNFPVDGDVLCRHDGQITDGKLHITASGAILGGGTVSVNGVAATMTDGWFSAPVSLEADAVRDEKLKILASLAHPSVGGRESDVVIGQYLARRKFGLDVLHSPDFLPPFRRNCRSIITIHDLAFLLYPHFLTKDSARYYGQIDEAVRRTDAIIAVSEATKDDIVRLLGVPESRVTVVYEAASSVFRPIDKQQAGSHVRERFGVRGDYAFFISTIEPRKNVPTLLKAFRKLLNDYRLDLQLVLAGEKGWLYDEVFQLVTDLDLVDHVVFAGRVSTSELVSLYNAAQVLVAPSIYEGFGLTPLEAMACGTPAIVSNVSSLPEVVGDAGLLVDPYDVEQLAVAMWRAVTDSELRKSLITKGLKRASFFSWDRAARETLELYHRLA